MPDTFELRHQPTKWAVVYVRVGPLVIGSLLALAAVASAAAIATQNLYQDQQVTAWFLLIGGVAGSIFVLHRAWRTWPAASRNLVAMRLDEQGPALRKGRFRDETWYRVPWSVLEAVAFTPVPPGSSYANPALLRARVIRFVPRQDADLPARTLGRFERLLDLPAREAALSFIVASTWDDDIRELLAWVRANRPELRVEDTIDPST